MDVVTLARRSARALALAGLLGTIGASLPMAALADGPVPTQMPQVAQARLAELAARRTGPGFDQHQQVRGNEVHVDVNICSKAVGPQQAHCDARVRTDSRAVSARPARGRAAQPNGDYGNSGAYDPSYLQSAYNLTSLSATAGRGQVVAVVDAYDNPNALNDLNTYRSQFGLPTLANCSNWPSTSACFRKVNQTGGLGPYPQPDQGWAGEIALDLDMVSAICPNCTILLVEANSNSFGDLIPAVGEAVTLGANVVSNSYSAGEWNGETGWDNVFQQNPGVAFTASTGDAGYGVGWPAASQYVTAVGGTSLTQTTNAGTRNGFETAWSGAGSGCSLYETKPTWQKDASCAKRMVADVSAVADPETPVWVYDTYGGAGWEWLGGTSASAPIVGAVYALAGNSRGSGVRMNSDPYANVSALFDANGGSNGSCGVAYFCTGVAGYDGPTGLGSPNGTVAFTNTTGTSQAPLPDFSLTATKTSLTAIRGGTTVSSTLTLSALNSYHNSVQLSISGVPSGVTASFARTSLIPTGTVKLSVHATRSAARTTTPVPLTITARGADGTAHTLTIQLTVS